MGQYIPPIALTVSYSGTSSYLPANSPAQRQYVLDTTNYQYVRSATLTSDSLYLQYFTSSAVISLANLYAVAAQAIPAIAWPPIITSQPTASIVTHTASAYFSVTATQAPSSSVNFSYQWYSSSYSQSLSGSSSPLTASTQYYGVTSSYLTVVTTSVSMSNSQYYVSVSNPSGITYSSTALLTVN